MSRSKRRGITFDSPDEREVFHAKESWVPLILGAIPILIAGSALAIIALVCANPMLSMILFAATIVIAIATRIPRIIANLDTDVIITNKRLYSRRGIINIEDHVCDLSNISDVTVDPSLFGRIFDYADVRIQTYAGESDFVLKGIAHAYDMRAAISRGADAERASGHHDHHHGEHHGERPHNDRARDDRARDRRW